jgi:putative ABC transport system permease protein
MSDLSYYKYLTFSAEQKDNSFVLDIAAYSAKSVSLTFITTKDYSKITGKDASLSDNEILIYNKGKRLNDSFTIFDKTFTIKTYLDSLSLTDDYTDNVLKSYVIVVSNDSVLKNLYESQLKAYEKYASEIKFHIGFNTDGSEKDKINCYNALNDALKTTSGKAPFIECRQEVKAGFYAIYGGLLFLGLFLGTLFLMATVLIIYYKQISEGYDDKNRFEIMQKVGMSKDEIRSSIRSQVLTVFFIPIIMAAIHILAAFKMITKLLALLGLTNLSLFAWCTVACVVIFSLIYAAVYALTAKVYYKIVC